MHFESEPASDRSEMRYEYDSNGNRIHETSSNGAEEWYDTNGKLIHYKDSDESEYWCDYDANGTNHIIHKKFADGSEEWYEYDTNGTLIHMNDSEGFEWKCSRKEITK